MPDVVLSIAVISEDSLGEEVCVLVTGLCRPRRGSSRLAHQRSGCRTKTAMNRTIFNRLYIDADEVTNRS